MVKFLYDVTNPEAYFGVLLEHQGDPYPGLDRLHILHVTVSANYTPGLDAAFFGPTTEDQARLLAQLCTQRPDSVQFACCYCHPTRPVPYLLRWDLIPIEPPTPLVPVEVGEDIT